MAKVLKDKMYQRQTTLKEIGVVGQQKLQNASVTIVGCGGLGSVAAIYLAASGVGNIHLIDFDTIDVSNLHRQVFYRLEDIGKSKADVLSNYIKSISPFVNVSYSSKAISKENVVDLLASAEIVLDCTDVLPIKYLLNDACVLHNKILVYGSLYKFDGYVATFNLIDKNGKRTANLSDAFPEMPNENIQNCSEIGTLNTIVGIIGLMQANEVLKIVTLSGQPLINQLLIYNSLDNSQYKMKLKSTYTKKKISALFNVETYDDILCETNDELLISQIDFKSLLNQESHNFKLVSVIENESQELPFDIDERVPISILEDWISTDFDETKEYVFVCNRGLTSMIAALQIKHDFPHTHVLSLEGGIAGF